MSQPPPTPNSVGVVAKFRQLIKGARQRAATAVNAELSLLYWQACRRIHHEVLGNERTGYAEKIVAILGPQLTAEYGRGWRARHLWLCILPARTYPSHEVMHALCAILSWSHIVELLRTFDTLARDFFENQSLRGRRSLRAFIGQISSSLLSRLAATKDNAGILQLASHGQILEQPVDLAEPDASLEARRDHARALGHWMMHELLTGRTRLA
jgi:hypothetical protein